MTFSVLTDTGGRPSGHNDRMVTGADTDEWFTEVRPEWAGHTWASWSATNDSRLVAEAATWAGQPLGTLYLHASNLDRAYAAAVAISDLACQALTAEPNPPPQDLRTTDSRGRSLVPIGPVVVGLIDVLTVPDDPDPEQTETYRREHSPAYSAADSRASFLYCYSARLRLARLAVLRLPGPEYTTSSDRGWVLDQVADGRRGDQLPMLVASVVPPDRVEPVYGGRVAWRLGFANPDGSHIGLSTPDAAVLDLDRPPGT